MDLVFYVKYEENINLQTDRVVFTFVLNILDQINYAKDGPVFLMVFQLIFSSEATL